MFIEESSKPKDKLKAWYLFTEDFVAGTQHLTNQEIGIYIRLLCWNWNKRCSGIPNNKETYYRIASAFADHEKFSCEKVIKENFVLVNEHWQNERQLQEYLYITKRIEASKENGKLGGRPKKPSTNPPTPTSTPTINNTYNGAFEDVWNRLYNKRGSKYRAYEQYKIAIKFPDVDSDRLVMGYNKLCSATDEKKFVPHFSKWLKDQRWEEFIPEPTTNLGVVNHDDTRLQMFVDAIRDKKVTRFVKDWALKHKDVIDRGIKLGKITKQQAIEDLEMANEYR